MFLRFFRENQLTAVGAVLVLVLVGAAILAPNITPYGPQEMQLKQKHQPPSLSHPFGTDFFGRDVLTRIVYGIRISLLIGVLVVSINMLVGVTVGLISGYYGGWIENLFMQITDIFLVFPTILFALAIMAVRGQGFASLILAMTLKGWTAFARLTRSEVLHLKEKEFILAARSVGASTGLILIRHVLANCVSIILVYASLAIATPILSEAALSFLGLGLPPPTPSLGLMLAAERAYMMRAWWTVTFPGLTIMMTVLGFNLLGDGLRDILDPRLTGGRST